MMPKTASFSGQLYTESPDKKKKTSIRRTAVRETGISVGIMGHPSNPQHYRIRPFDM